MTETLINAIRINVSIFSGWNLKIIFCVLVNRCHFATLHNAKVSQGWPFVNRISPSKGPRKRACAIWVTLHLIFYLTENPQPLMFPLPLLWEGVVVANGVLHPPTVGSYRSISVQANQTFHLSWFRSANWYQTHLKAESPDLYIGLSPQIIV